MTITEGAANLDAERFVGAAMEPKGISIDAPVRIPTERYLSPEFAALENELMWPKVWVVACTLDHVAEPGDFAEVRFGWNSVIVVRGEDGALRAFQNVCRHRGNAICQGSGSGLSELRCGYHRWAWDLQGQLREVPSRKGFGPIRNEDLPLFPVQVDTWARLVFVNLDPDAEPLSDWLEGMPDDIAWAEPDAFRAAYVTTTPVRCNWKVVSEGFSETYHVQGLHREMLGSMDDINSGQRFWNRVGVSYQPYGIPSPRLGRDVEDKVVWDSFVITQGGRMGPDYGEGGARTGEVPDVPEGSTMQEVIAQKIREHQASSGVDLSKYDTDQILRLNQYNLFPNTTVLVSGDLFTVLTSRPGPTPDESELVIVHLVRAPSADAPRTRPMDVVVPMDQAHFGFVFDQDLGVLERMQVGLHQRGMREIVLSREEARIVNMHRNLERYLGLPPGGRLADRASA
jgi:phenylpropionate dioxygenase-like ring-hydroxylating dioxygenase large terminal subunit